MERLQKRENSSETLIKQRLKPNSNLGKYINFNLGCKNIFDYVDSRAQLDNDYLRDILTTYDPGRRYFAEFKVSYKDFSR